MYPTTPQVCCRTTCGMLKFKFATNYIDEITTFDETKYILPYGSADNAIVKFTTDARNVHLLPAHTLEDAYATRQLHRQ